MYILYIRIRISIYHTILNVIGPRIRVRVTIDNHYKEKEGYHALMKHGSSFGVSSVFYAYIIIGNTTKAGVN